MKGQKDTMLEDEPPRSEGSQYATGEEQRAITNSSRKNEASGSKQKRLCCRHLVVKVKSDVVKNSTA